MNKGVFLGGNEEVKEADQLRQACHDALCRTSQRSKEFPDARKQILYGYGDLNQYCSQLARPTFWGGEVEMMVIATMLKVPIFVYTSNAEKTGGCVTFVVACFSSECVSRTAVVIVEFGFVVSASGGQLYLSRSWYAAR
jgi:OTU-like cysteine protease